MPKVIEVEKFEFNSSLDLDKYEELLEVSVITQNKALVNGLISLVINDVLTDLAKSEVPDKEIRQYYRRYYEVAQDNSFADSWLLQALDLSTTDTVPKLVKDFNNFYCVPEPEE